MQKYINDFNSFFYNGGWKSPLSMVGYFILFGWCFHAQIHQLISNILTSPELAHNIIDSLATIGGFCCILFKDQMFKKDK